MQNFFPFFIQRLSTIFALLLLLSPTAVEATEIKRLPLENADSIGTKISTDYDAKVEGTGAIKITTLWPTTICLGEVPGLSVDNVKLIFHAKVKSEKFEGKAYLEMWCFVKGKKYFSRGLNSFVTGTSNWQTLQTPFFLKKNQIAESVVLNIVLNGSGIIWVDDAILSKQELSQ
ncbi:MAG: hypothetical protein KJO26_12990 [Deltaproteobacteria bacterium]|nr:hypothetical protein [Deltaproteobacteria bacterium]NNK86371.1 hypothetical protein [Desulfobacterales bacterium]